jgi:hypothetical protein
MYLYRLVSSINVPLATPSWIGDNAKGFKRDLGELVHFVPFYSKSGQVGMEAYHFPQPPDLNLKEFLPGPEDTKRI